MQRLTVTRLPFAFRQHHLPPPDRQIGKGGNTSIIYDCGDTVDVLTVEQAKCEWWLYAGLIDDFTQVTTADYAGYKSSYYGPAKFMRGSLPVYRCTVPKLAALDAEQKRYAGRMRKAINRSRWDVSTYGLSQDEANIRYWDAISLLVPDWPELSLPVQFAFDYGASLLYADFGPGDFMVWNDKVFALDPFHAVSLSVYLHLSKYNPDRRPAYA